MTAKFDPAPTDKHADSIETDRHGGKADNQLDISLEDSFPASDPPSSTQPAKSTADDRTDNDAPEAAAKD
jgi:hypothetical protein